MDVPGQNIELRGWVRLPLNLHPKLASVLANAKIKLSEIQRLVIPLIATSCDIVAISTLGMGVTNACVYGILNTLCLDASPQPGLEAMILLPTRELAAQVYHAINSLQPAHGLLL
ncbi:hypothetical protein BDV36DRAFT_295494 [Aspergillus pseudocaelatus]|uniref:ATP-dependent RNA helicase n=1 Tax=Aspergillus pseudocaelatus TaxID=1825620 RepID=A0ABQ6WLX7_9EURO|nr:hypothetical protein BDV36DRAFT_295494 [Aspergillus pseudocaelatus]